MSETGATGSTAATRPSVPLPAAMLGAAGLVPFVGLGAGVWLLEESLREITAEALAAYGATILAFMGGCRWGFAAAGLGAGPSTANLTLAVMPSLYAWIAILIPGGFGMLLIAIGLFSLLMADVSLTRRGGAPAWWIGLRVPLTAGAVLSLLAGAVGIGVAPILPE